MHQQGPIIPRATYRIQLTAEFGFERARQIAPYVAGLGVSHVYCSPFFAARPGSKHGYDVIDHSRLNPELGPDAEFEAMVAAFKAQGLGIIADFVPNHMGVGGASNRFYLDLLEWGPLSPYAGWFDVRWVGRSPELRGKILVPFLGAPFEEALDNGDLRLKLDAENGSLGVWAYDTHLLPIAPASYGRIIAAGGPETADLAEGFGALARVDPGCAHERGSTLKHELAARLCGSAQLRGAVEAEIARLNADRSELGRLIGEQNWHAEHFSAAADRVNYRRFFNIADLAGLRIEVPEVFDYAHGLLFDLIGRGVVDGVRIDHIDGLWDPAGYCRLLREKAPRPFYLLLEKIVAPHEELRADWHADGTTGYEFANLVTGLLVDPQGECALSEACERFAGQAQSFEAIAREAKLQIIDTDLRSEFETLAADLEAYARANPAGSVLEPQALRSALRNYVASLAVYRTYFAGGELAPEDRREIDAAIERAASCATREEWPALEFLRGVCLGSLARPSPDGPLTRAAIGLAMRIQQYTGPVMAKGVEDTAFYRYNRLLARNEVGGEPGRFAVDIAAFHDENLRRRERLPHTMLTSSTHDTKRGEDARARIAALSGLGPRWGEAVARWSAVLRDGVAPGELPERNDEYFFYQLLIGAWPSEFLGAPPEGEALAGLHERVAKAMEKSVREAKQRTFPTAPEPGYERAVGDFVARALDPEGAFFAEFGGFAAEVARLGAANSLIQTLLKFTVPGVPDIYQGAELWDFNLVDPDNRRAVNFERALDRYEAGGTCIELTPEALASGSAKQALIGKLLGLRRAAPELFSAGSYEPLEVAGDEEGRVVAFLRRHGGRALVVAAQLYPWRGELAGGSARIRVPAGQRWENLVDGRSFDAEADGIDAAELFARVPVAALTAGESGP